MQLGSAGKQAKEAEHQAVYPQQEEEQQQQSEEEHPMDEFLDNMISIPSWSEVGVHMRSHWDYNASSSPTFLDCATSDCVTAATMAAAAASKVFKSSASASSASEDNIQYTTDSGMLVPAFQSQMSAELASLHGISLSEDIAAASSAAAWCQQFAPSLHIKQQQQEVIATGDPKKRYREDERAAGATPGSQAYGSSTTAAAVAAAATSSCLQPSPSQNACNPNHAVASGLSRPRVRARRGQATDPHSIAERLRRERIAERMKALQELVPNANKTDKASMLDEIIDYVKFLQLQVKVLSMSRLGAAGSVAPLIADLPANEVLPISLGMLQQGGNASSSPQEGISLNERQVARLMEEDMGTAMQYLQSKGLCLMPISLASSAIASPKASSSSQQRQQQPRQVPAEISGEKNSSITQEPEQS